MTLHTKTVTAAYSARQKTYLQDVSKSTQFQIALSIRLRCNSQTNGPLRQRIHDTQITEAILLSREIPSMDGLQCHAIKTKYRNHSLN